MRVSSTPAAPSPVPAGTDTGEVAELMVGCVKRVRRLLDDALAEHGLSLSRAKLLGALTGGPCHQGTLAGTFDLAPRTITELLDGLERKGLIERTVDPADRRARRVHLTPAGSQAHQLAMAIRAELLDTLLGDLGAAKLTELSSILREVQRELDTYCGSTAC